MSAATRRPAASDRQQLDASSTVSLGWLTRAGNRACRTRSDREAHAYQHGQLWGEVEAQEAGHAGWGMHASTVKFVWVDDTSGERGRRKGCDMIQARETLHAVPRQAYVHSDCKAYLCGCISTAAASQAQDLQVWASSFAIRCIIAYDCCQLLVELERQLLYKFQPSQLTGNCAVARCCQDPERVRLLHAQDI